MLNSGPLFPTPGIVTIVNFTANHPPIARAGSDQVVSEGTLVTLNGSASSDPDGDGLSFSWTQFSGPGVTLLTSSSTSTSFNTPTVNADTLLTFNFTVADSVPNTSLADFVNVIVSDTDTFLVSTTLTDGVLSGSQSVGDIFAGTTYGLQIDGSLPSAELEQIVIPTGVTTTGVDFSFSESSQVTSGIADPDLVTALFLDLNFTGVDFSTASNFLSGILPKVQFLVDSGFSSAQSFADGCAVMEIQLLNEISGLWEQIGDTQQANTNKIYVSNVGSGFTPGTLSVIDGSTNNVIDTITIGFVPKLVSFDQTANRIYVANQGSNTVSVIDGSTNNLIATIPVGVAPAQAVINPNTGNIYVTNQGSGTVTVIDGSTNNLITTITVGVTPVGVAVDTNLNQIYVTNTFGNSISVIDGNPANATGTYHTVNATIQTVQPSGIVVDSSNSRVYVNNFDDRQVSVIDVNPANATGTLNTVISIIPVGSGSTGLTALRPAATS